MKNIISILLLSAMLYSCENNNSKSENSSKVVEDSIDFNGLTQLKGQTFYAYHQKNPYNGESVSFLEDGRVRLGNSVCEVEMNSNIKSDEITLKYNEMSCKFSFTDNNLKGDLVGNVLMKGQQIFLHIKSLKDNGSGIDTGYYELFHELKDEKDIERIISSNEKLLNEIDNKENSETNSNKYIDDDNSNASYPSKLEDKCYELLNNSVKDCNGGLVSTRNFHQINASFSPLGYAALNDDEHLSYQGVDFYLHKTNNIKFQHVISINVNKMTFEYSCICVEFAEGFSPNSYYVGIQKPKLVFYKIGDKVNFSNGTYNVGKSEIIEVEDGQVVKVESETEYFDPIYLETENRWPIVYYASEQMHQGGFSFVVKSERAQDCIKAITQLVSLAREKNANNQKESLIRHEEYNGNSLYVWFTDSSGIKQGRYEIKDENGVLICYGNYIDNRKVGNWLEWPGRYKDYGPNGIITNECSCQGYQ